MRYYQVFEGESLTIPLFQRGDGGRAASRYFTDEDTATHADFVPVDRHVQGGVNGHDGQFAYNIIVKTLVDDFVEGTEIFDITQFDIFDGSTYDYDYFRVSIIDTTNRTLYVTFFNVDEYTVDNRKFEIDFRNYAMAKSHIQDEIYNNEINIHTYEDNLLEALAALKAKKIELGQTLITGSIIQAGMMRTGFDQLDEMSDRQKAVVREIISRNGNGTASSEELKGQQKSNLGVGLDVIENAGEFAKYSKMATGAFEDFLKGKGSALSIELLIKKIQVLATKMDALYSYDTGLKATINELTAMTDGDEPSPFKLASDERDAADGDSSIHSVEFGPKLTEITLSYTLQSGREIVLGSEADQTVTVGDSQGVYSVDLEGGYDGVTFAGSIRDYSIDRLGDSLLVAKDGLSLLASNVELLRFADYSLNLHAAEKLAQLPPAVVAQLTELYVAFFGRVPDAGGLAYWADKYSGGADIGTIVDEFYQAGVQFSELTGYDSEMDPAAFIAFLYQNVLARTEATAPTSSEISYWTGRLAEGVPRSQIVADMLEAAKTFANDPTWGWVSSLLENKVALGHVVAVDYGLAVDDPELAYSLGRELLAAVTAQDYSAAVELIGLPGIDLS